MTVTNRRRLVLGAVAFIGLTGLAANSGSGGTEGEAAAATPSPAEAERLDALGAGALSFERKGRVPDATEVARPIEVLEGSASYYADALTGRRTASGERYDPRALIAAHRSLPFGTVLRVTNLENDRTVEVRVVDRGPFARGRVLDLSRRAAERIDMIRAGHVRVRIEVLEYGA